MPQERNYYIKPMISRLRVVPHFSSGIVGRGNASARENHPTREKAPFLAWGDFHARSRFARPTIPEEKWGTTRSLMISHFALLKSRLGQGLFKNAGPIAMSSIL